MTFSSKPGDLISELLLGMRLSGVQFRRSVLDTGAGVGFSNTAGRGQFHFVGRGPVWLRSAAGALHALDSGDALLVPHGGAHAMLPAADTPRENIEVVSSHLGLANHPAVLAAVADRLAQPEDGWQAFIRQGGPLPAWLYPEPTPARPTGQAQV